MKLIFVVFVIYIGFAVFLYHKQRSFIYFPVDSQISVENVEEFKNENQTIRVSVVNPGMAKAYIYFGGNAENVDVNVTDFSGIFRGHTVYLVKYRGYGGSTGHPTEQGIYSDALAIYDQVAARHGSLSVMGRSLGSAVATWLASQRETDKLILITPFDSIAKMAQARFPVYPMSILLEDRHDSMGRVNDIHASTLIIGAKLDQVIPASNTENLVRAFGNRAFYEVIEGAGHNDIASFGAYKDVLQRFIHSASDKPIPDRD